MLITLKEKTKFVKVIKQAVIEVLQEDMNKVLIPKG